MSKKFGDCLVQYGSVIDHNVYEYLRVSIEVPRGETKRGVVMLRGKPVGEVHWLSKNSFAAYRYIGNRKKLMGNFKDVGFAAANIITTLL